MNNKVSGLVKAINYLINYSKMKEGIKNEKYIILFTDIFNMKNINDEHIEIIKNNLKEDKESIFLLVGKSEKIDSIEENNDFTNNCKKLEESIMSKFGEKSDIIIFENMKKIKTILSNNKLIRDENIFPNEIYKKI